jgi:hypothetical protein
MPASGMFRHVAFVRTNVSEEPTASIIRVKWRNFAENGIFHCRRRGNLKSYLALTGWAV